MCRYQGKGELLWGGGVGVGLGGGIVQKRNSPDLRFAEVGISATLSLKIYLLNLGGEKY